MRTTRLAIPDVMVFEPDLHPDDRGFLYESYRERDFDQATRVEESVGLPRRFVQDNHSKSNYGVLRGMHYQVAPQTQGKLVRVVAGEVFDVAVDLRKRSPHFGRWVSVVLSATNRRQLWVPEGFAHGFLVLSPAGAECVYKATAYYAPEHERCLRWDDPSVGILWPTGINPQVSAKDAKGLPLDRCATFS